MSKLNIDQKTVLALFSAKDALFLIPDYQRPYAWGEQECQTLWDDIFSFALPDNNCNAFDSSSEYFLGPIVTFQSQGQKEIIDGQQRLTTLLLLLRAFYACFGNMNDDAAKATRKSIESCIWKTNEFDAADKDSLKIESEVATDNDREEFMAILKTGEVSDKSKSRYAHNYRFFLKQIAKFKDEFPMYYSYLPIRIMKNCILLPIEAESQDTALRIFSTLNDRGMPLSDSDIFKAQFYKFYSHQGKKDEFIHQWKELEEKVNKIFHPVSGNAMDDLFTRYMYYIRARQGNKNSTTEALRKFYEKDSYSLLKQEQTFLDMIELADFWNDVSNQDEERFSSRILRRFYVLNYAPNSMWIYFVSVYFMSYRDKNGQLDEERFYKFLNRITAFIWAYAIVRPGVNALRTPVYAEMINLVNKRPVTFEDFKFTPSTFKEQMKNYEFTNQRPITKAMLTWWAFHKETQKLLKLETVLDIEHIFARARQMKEKSLNNAASLEMLGNKVILEKRINIRAADFRFADKKKYYNGYENSKGQRRSGTEIRELLDISANYSDFREEDIIKRQNHMIEEFIEYLDANDLVK